MPDQTKLWEKFSEILRNEVSEMTYDTWFQQLSLLSIREDGVYMQVDNLFTKRYVEDKYLAFLQEASNQVMGKGRSVKLLLPEEWEEIQKKEEQDKKAQVDLVKQSANALGLNPRYTFETFVIGNANRLAHAAAQAVASEPARAYNPFFIYGGVGLGKTHLMHAIGHAMLSNKPNCRLVYLSSESFTNQLIDAIDRNAMQEFRNRFRYVDALLVDDIQFIAGKEQTQEEFFNTFNALYEQNKQIVISSDKQPKEIPMLEERLRSRFEWGLIADVQKPDFETRMAILRRKMRSEGFSVPDEVTSFIASKAESNIRELEGSLTRVMAFARLHGTQVSLSLAQEALEDLISVRDKRSFTPDFIMKVVADYYHVSMEDLKGKKRNRQITVPRMVAMYLVRDINGASLPRIGGEFGDRDHTTVMHACEKVARDLKSDAQLRAAVTDIRKQIMG